MTIQEFLPGLGMGELTSQMADSWTSIVETPVYIIVGVTGVGKSTTIEALQALGVEVTLLPNRRALTDHLIISYLQQQDGDPIKPVKDRIQRFDYTRRYRERFAGGMAHALAQLKLKIGKQHGMIFFDGLRGENEVTCALEELPNAQFIVLAAPDVVRTQRLLGRADSFDQVSASERTTQSHSLDIEGIEDLFSQQEIDQLLALVDGETVTIDDLRAKLQIVMTERRNYDPTATASVLMTRVPERTLIVDTTMNTPEEAAQQIQAFMK
ncbi:MAG: AAA family ATPase [Chloroflexota bacterium]